MAKIKGKHAAPKIKKGQSNTGEGCSSDQHPFFSFRYMTQNKHYTISALDPLHGAKREESICSLYHRLEEISSHPWMHWGQQRKTTGYETIFYDELAFETAAKIPKDCKVIVFRFDTHIGPSTGRIIGFKDSPCSAFHIIGYDFDFSAYKHS